MQWCIAQILRAVTGRRWWRRSRFRAHLDPEVPAECRKSSAESRADGAELPHALVAVEFADDNGGLHGEAPARLIAEQLRPIRRILVYTFIYEGVANWQEADGVVTVRCPGSPDIVVRMDEYGSSQGMCAIAMLESHDGTMSVEKLVRFFRGHESLDRAYHWGLRWEAGSKD